MVVYNKKILKCRSCSHLSDSGVLFNDLCHPCPWGRFPEDLPYLNVSAMQVNDNVVLWLMRNPAAEDATTLHHFWVKCFLHLFDFDACAVTLVDSIDSVFQLAISSLSSFFHTYFTDSHFRDLSNFFFWLWVLFNGRGLLNFYSWFKFAFFSEFSSNILVTRSAVNLYF